MPPQTPVATPVTFSFDSGGIQLTSVIDLENKEHSMTCDLCSQVIKLGIRGSINHISQHRDGERCKRKAFKVSKLVSKNRNLVSDIILIMLCFCTNKLMAPQEFGASHRHSYCVQCMPEICYLCCTAL